MYSNYANSKGQKVEYTLPLAEEIGNLEFLCNEYRVFIRDNETFYVKLVVMVTQYFEHILFLVFFFVFLPFLGPLLQHIEIPIGV